MRVSPWGVRYVMQKRVLKFAASRRDCSELHRVFGLRGKLFPSLQLRKNRRFGHVLHVLSAREPVGYIPGCDNEASFEVRHTLPRLF